MAESSAMSGKQRLSQTYFAEAEDTAAADAICSLCGEPLEDFTPCACHLGSRTQPRRTGGSMRELVERKLSRQAAEKKDK